MRGMKGFNGRGLYTLYMKEVKRYMKVYNQTILAPVMTAMLFLAVFTLAVGQHVEKVGEVPFALFMASGLIMMSVMQNAFANSSSSFTMGKIMGIIVDYLMPPISAFEMMCGMVGAAVTRGIKVGVLVAIAVYLFFPYHIEHPWIALFFLVSASLFLALLGMIAGNIAETFDQMSAVNSYIVTPLAFLSGTFYSVEHLPPFWHTVSQYNPFFYLIDGFRYGMTGYADSSLLVGAVYVTLLNILLWLLANYMLFVGYRVKQ